MNYTVYNTISGEILRTGYVNDADLSAVQITGDGEAIYAVAAIDADRFYFKDGAVTPRPEVSEEYAIEHDKESGTTSLVFDVPDGTTAMLDWAHVDVIDGVVTLPSIRDGSVLIVTPPFPCKPFSVRLQGEA